MISLVDNRHSVVADHRKGLPFIREGILSALDSRLSTSGAESMLFGMLYESLSLQDLLRIPLHQSQAYKYLSYLEPGSVGKELFGAWFG